MMQTEQRAMELEAELALAHDALQDWRTLTANMSSSTSEDSWRWVHAAEEEARNRQEAVLRSLINFMHTKQEQMDHQKHRLSRRGSSDGGSTSAGMTSAATTGSSPFGRRRSIAPEDMMSRRKANYDYPEFRGKTFEKMDEGGGSGDEGKDLEEDDDDTMSPEEEKRQEAKLRQVEQLVRRMSLHLEETVNVSAPRVAPTMQDVSTSSKMRPFRR